MTLGDVNYGLYLVTDRTVLKGRDFLTSIEDAILGGVSIIQLREKDASSLEFYNLAKKVRKLTARYNIPLIINDRVDIALAVGADGVHVGQNDLPATVVREMVGPDLLIGVSTATLEEALKAEQDGADYIGVGALFTTSTKTNTRVVTPSQLNDIKNAVNIPVVAIGGINERNIHELHDTGINGIAVVSAILGKENIQDAAKKLLHFKI